MDIDELPDLTPGWFWKETKVDGDKAWRLLCGDESLMVISDWVFDEPNMAKVIMETVMPEHLLRVN